jgi:hypothetical protein
MMMMMIMMMLMMMLMMMMMNFRAVYIREIPLHLSSLQNLTLHYILSKSIV